MGIIDTTTHFSLQDSIYRSDKRSLIPVYEPFISPNQKEYVIRCLDSNVMSWHSPFVDYFETSLARYLGVKHCISVCNGSVSLMLALKALGVKPGDEVITQNLTYAATVSSILNVGAIPVLIDSDHSYQMDISLLEGAITDRTRAVIVAGLYGDCCNIDEVSKLCRSRSIALLEDAAEVFGCNTVDGRKLGTIGDIGSFSFFSNKTISAVEGGCVTTDNQDLAEELKLLRGQSHIGNFQHRGPGYNFRFNGLLAAIGCAQLECIDQIVKRKKEIANFYRGELEDVLINIRPNIQSVEWMPLFQFRTPVAYSTFKNYMLMHNVDTRPCFTPISKMDGFDYKSGSNLDVSEAIYKLAFNLPCYPALTDDHLDHIVKAVKSFVSQQRRFF